MQRCALGLAPLEQDECELNHIITWAGPGKPPCSECAQQCRCGLRLSRLCPKAREVRTVGVHQMLIFSILSSLEVLQTSFKSKYVLRLDSGATAWTFLCQWVFKLLWLLSSCNSVVGRQFTSVFWVSLENERIAHLFSQTENRIQKSVLQSSRIFPGL